MPEIEVEALTRDLDRLADASSLTVDDLIAQQQFARAVNDLETKFPANYVSAGVPTENSDAYWVMLKNEPSEAELAALSGLPVDVKVQSGANASAAQFEAAAGKLSQALVKSFPDAMGLMVGPAPDGSALEVKFDEDVISAEDIRRIAKETLGEQIPVDPISVGPIRTSLFSAMEGGRQMRVQSSGAAACTTGFTVDRTNGNPGLITAEHCPNDLMYMNTPNTLIFGAAATDNTDMQFHRRLEPHTVHPRFRADAGDIRKVLDYGNAPIGATVCKWGEVTGYTCGTMTDGQNLCITGGYCGIDAVDRLYSDHGDSGGPVFLGTVARGIVSGLIGTSFGTFDSITRSSRVANSMGGTVRTTTP